MLLQFNTFSVNKSDQTRPKLIEGYSTKHLNEFFTSSQRKYLETALFYVF